VHQVHVHVEHLISCFPTDGSSFDIQELFYRLTLDSATDFLFGDSVNSLVPASSTQSSIPFQPIEGSFGFADAFNLSQDYIAKRARAESLYWLINPKEFRQANDTVHQLVDHYVRFALMPKEKRGNFTGDRQRYIFLEALVEETNDPKMLRDQLLNVLLAGRDTTASLPSSTFYLLARYPRVWGKLRHEILDKLGTTEQAKTEISFTSLKDIPYLRHVLDEGICNTRD
jgi:cytochrome P450